ncbi:MAG: hypothetical protein U9P49_06380 [Thermodesulfobacteriota bacterium]|nr:hypothetical protein [Thermodesulfobacteriota bacterium]
MEHNFILASITHKKEEDGQGWKYKYKTVKPILEKKLEIMMETKDPMSAEANTGLPLEIGDIITVDIGKTNTQGKLNVKDEKEDD